MKDYATLMEKLLLKVQKIQVIQQDLILKKSFFTKDERIDDKYQTLVKFDLNGGMVEFIWEVWLNNKVILGSPWGTYSIKLGMNGGRIKKPIFGTYKDLDEIFRIGFELYEDFKKALILQ